MLFPFFLLLHLAPNVNNPHVYIKLLDESPTINNPHVCIKNSLSLISRDSRTPRNSGTNFNLEGENVTGYRYMIHLYCLAVQAGFYSDVVECRTLSPADRVRSPVGEKCYFHFFTCYTTFTVIADNLLCSRLNFILYFLRFRGFSRSNVFLLIIM